MGPLATTEVKLGADSFTMLKEPRQKDLHPRPTNNPGPMSGQKQRLGRTNPGARRGSQGRIPAGGREKTPSAKATRGKGVLATNGEQSTEPALEHPLVQEAVPEGLREEHVHAARRQLLSLSSAPAR